MSEQDVTIGEVYRAVCEVRDHLKQLNGSVGHHETRIAVLEDRGQRKAALWGTGAGLVGTGVATLIKGWLWK